MTTDEDLFREWQQGSAGALEALVRRHHAPLLAHLIQGQSRLDEMETNAPELAADLRQHLAAGSRFPEWTDDDLRAIIPDDHLGQALLAELRPRPLVFFIEPMPDVPGWPDAPCAYLQLSAAYEKPAAAAMRWGWPTRAFDAGHFHMLVDPSTVAGALIELAACYNVGT
jgi:hypothetical protein